MVTMSGTLSGFTTNVKPTTTRYPTDLGEDIYITTDEGTSLSFNASGSMYLTANVSDYQRYSVEMELYEWAVDVLDDIATPTYEFSVDSANFLFAQEFAPFRNQLELGKGVYLNIGGKHTITPYIIEFELDFEERNKFSIVFSNRFKRHDNVNTLKDMIESSYSTSRSFDASKYIYNQTVGQASMVSKFMSDSLDAAKNTILAAANQSVIINGAGIHVGGDSKYQIRIVDSMIAMSDDNWGTCKLAIGHFASPEVGEYFGVNAEVIGGKLIVGNNLIIENKNDDGVMQFKVDSSGAWLNNSTFVLQKDNGGKIIIDPKYGIVGGSGALYTTNGTTVTPSFIKSNGSIDKDTDEMPKNANFFLDIQNGNAYFRGKLIATSGKLGGFDIASSYLYSGTGSNRVAVNGGTSYYSLYAFWAGNENPANAPFWVQKNGKMRATDCLITGTLDASKIKGSLTAETGAELVGPAIYVPNKTAPKFKVDSSGNVTMSGDIHMENGNITWGTSSSPVRVLYSRTYASTPTMLYTNYPVNSSSGWHRALDTGRDIYASHSYDGGKTWTAAIKLQGEDGEDGRDGRDGADGSDANVTRGNIARALYENSADYYNDGIYSYRYGSRYYLAINASYILAGDIDADNIALTCGYGGFSKGYGSTGTRRTYGSMMYGSNGKGYEPYFIVTDVGCRMSAPNDIDFFVTGGGVYSAEEPSITSDRRLKNSIEYNMEKYEKFFMLLKPTQYRLNRGMSGRFHTGFIAQDVEQAVLESGLELTDFAGITIMPVEEVNEKDGIEDNYYKLRYGEFISLNTHMIQKLYRRIDELEEKINSMN